MIYLDLILNLSLLVALSVVSGFIDKRWQRNTRLGVLLQGTLFGCVAVIGMLRPMVLGPGLIFDGRSVMISLCALFFGPWAVSVTFVITTACRIALGGAGTFMGISVILSSAVIGLAAYYRFKPSLKPPSVLRLYYLGLAVHLVMVALMFTLPEGNGLATFKRLGLPVILLYPLATILTGKILSDQFSNMQTIDALRESEERYRLLFDASLDAVLLTSPNGGIIAANPAACHLFGKTEEDLIGSGRNAVVDTTDPRLASALEERERTGRFNGELTYVRKDGSKFEGEVSSSVFLNREGDAQTSMIIRDITERKRKEQLIAESEKKFEITFQSSPDPAVISDGLSGMLLDVNNAFVNWSGYSRQELIGNTFNKLDIWINLDEMNLTIRQFLDGTPVRNKEITFRTKSGQLRQVLFTAQLIELEGKRLLLSHAQDITEMKQAEKEIRELNEDLEQKIKKRTIDLRGTIAQLKELNQALVNRELKMVELKERIAELEKKT